MSIEYRVCWSASSNISFKGASDWIPYEGMDDDVTAEQVEDELNKPEAGGTEVWSQALQLAAEQSGFEYWVETRPAEGES